MPMDEDTIADKIRKLFAKADSTTSEHEAAALQAKAQELITRYQIDMARVWASGKEKDEEVIIRAMSFRNPNGMQKIALLNAIAKNNDCKVITLGFDYDFDGEKVELFGFESDIQVVQLFYIELLTHGLTSSTQLRMQSGSKVSDEVWNRDFMLAYSQTIADRLAATRKKVIDETPGVGMVLFDRNKLVVDHFKKIYPTTGRANAGSIRSDAAANAGRAAGRSADIGQTKIGGPKGIGSGR